MFQYQFSNFTKNKYYTIKKFKIRMGYWKIEVVRCTCITVL